MKIGVFGVGHLGKIHLKCLKETDWTIAGIYDPDEQASQKAADEYGVQIYTDMAALIADSDAIDIVSTTMSHYDVAIQAMDASKHIFIEKPMASSLEQAQKIVQLSSEKDIKVQVGHVERYNPAIKAIINRGLTPKFVEAHRLTMFNTRGNDVSVVYDLMIHDIDLVLSMIDSPIKDVQANGVCVVNDTPDICNARITFANGAVANLTASRISMKNMRKIRFFQEDEYISSDLIKKENQIISLTPTDEDTEGMTIISSSGKKLVNIEMPEVLPTNAIAHELQDFYNSIAEDMPTAVDANAGFAAMYLAHEIDKAMNL